MLGFKKVRVTDILINIRGLSKILLAYAVTCNALRVCKRPTFFTKGQLCKPKSFIRYVANCKF